MAFLKESRAVRDSRIPLYAFLQLIFRSWCEPPARIGNIGSGYCGIRAGGSQQQARISVRLLGMGSGRSEKKLLIKTPPKPHKKVGLVAEPDFFAFKE
jgi:hypothetical protein